MGIMMQKKKKKKDSLSDSRPRRLNLLKPPAMTSKYLCQRNSQETTIDEENEEGTVMLHYMQEQQINSCFPGPKLYAGASNYCGIVPIQVKFNW